MRKEKITLNFNYKISINPAGKHVRDGLSAALETGDFLWVCCDERSSIERLQLTDKHTFTNHQSFELNKYLDLPSDCEVDVEGLAQAGHYMWLVGSHSLARKKPKKEDSPDKQIKRLAKVKDDPNRYLLARIPLVKNAKSGEYELHKTCPNPDKPSETLVAGQLKRNKKGNQLLDVLTDDIHFKDFMRIPGKDNGFDIEGLAADGDKIYIGVRGPVLRGWAIILEIEVKHTQEDQFELKPDKNGLLYKKHFLHLEGMGIRELRIVENDILILAGPTMDLDGTIAVYRWRNGVNQKEEAMVHRKDLERLFVVPHGQGKTSGQDKAEGMTLFDNNHVLVVFDSPTDARKVGKDGVIADLYKFQ